MSSEFSPKVLELLGQSNKETVKIEPVSSGLVKKSYTRRSQLLDYCSEICFYLYLKV
jgi:hypothetical protein